jgi:hypothetical protein
MLVTGGWVEATRTIHASDFLYLFDNSIVGEGGI